MKLLLVLLMTLSSQVHACEEDLLFLLSEARRSIVNNFAKGEPCYNAALIGRTQGPPGCYPPGALQVQSLLKPVFKRAAVVCQQSCRNEGKAKSCQKIVDRDHLRNVGIDLLIKTLRTKGLPVDALEWDSLDIEDTIEI